MSVPRCYISLPKLTRFLFSQFIFVIGALCFKKLPLTNAVSVVIMTSHGQPRARLSAQSITPPPLSLYSLYNVKCKIHTDRDTVRRGGGGGSIRKIRNCPMITALRQDEKVKSRFYNNASFRQHILIKLHY